MNFNKASQYYDDYCFIQAQSAKTLSGLLNKFNLNVVNIADFGCGTGINTEIFIKNYFFKVFFAIDIADTLLQKAALRLNIYNVAFLSKNFEQKIFEDNFIDLAICNMALQWSENIDQTFLVIRQQLSRNGVFAFSLPIEGTFGELPLASRNKFFNFKKILKMLINRGFKIKEAHIRKTVFAFDSVFMALKSIKAIGANCVLKKKHKGLRGKNFLKQFGRKLTYRIGFFIVERGDYAS